MVQSRVGTRPQEVTIGMATYGAGTDPASFVFVSMRGGSIRGRCLFKRPHTHLHLLVFPPICRKCHSYPNNNCRSHGGYESLPMSIQDSARSDVGDPCP